MGLAKIIIPSVGESIQEVTISEWLKKDGDFVEKGEDVLSIDTDKASVEVAADVSGKLKISTQPGETVKVGTVVGTIDDKATKPKNAVTEQKKKPNIKDAVKPAKKQQITKTNNELENLSPAVRHQVLSKNINTDSIQGSGKDGRILKQDLNPKPRSAAPKDLKTIEPMSSIRKTIAKRLKGVQQTAAILSTFNEVDLTELMSLRARYQDEFIKKYDIKLGLMSVFIKACIESLKDFPTVNAFIEGDNIIYNNYYNIGVAVSTDNGLLVPVIKNADRMTLAELELAIKNFAELARNKKISLDDLSGGTFTVTNGGVFGSMLSTPILNAPQSGILGMHSIIERPVVVNSKIEIRKMMYLALSYDHRIVDGREAVSFLVKVKQCIEDPRRLLLSI